jgi:hypothetical protein
MFPLEELLAAIREDRFINVKEISCLVGTGNQLFWVGKVGDVRNMFSKQQAGWTRVDALGSNDELELLNDQVMVVENVIPIYKTVTPNVGFAGKGLGRYTQYGQLVDLRQGRIYVEQDMDVIENTYNDEVYWYDGENRYLCDVYNLEVEGCCAYYVGERGVWARHENCADGALIQAQP